MKNKVPKAKAHRCTIINFTAVATLLTLLSSCGHQPSKGISAGEKFLGNWTIEAVYHDPGEKGEDAPIDANGNFKIVRQPKPANGFELVPGERFKGEPAWTGLKLNYQPGNDEDMPAPLISDICAKKKAGSEEGEDETGYIKADVQFDFINLESRGLELLESKPVKFGEEEHMIHIFRILKIGANQPDLLIFYCKTSHCNHRGAAHAIRQQ